MLPIRDHNPSQTRPIITVALIVINLLVFVSYRSLSGDPAALAGFYQTWALVPAHVSAGSDWYTLITSMFLHAGFMHLGGNLLFLWIFGDNLEDKLGHAGFLAFYLVCGVAAGLSQMAASPASLVPTIGASGAIAGVMGGYLLLFPKARIDVLFIFIVFFKIFPIPAWAMLGVWFVLQIVNGIGTDISGGGVAFWAHVGGFVAGFVLVLPVWLRLGGTRFWRQSAGRPPHPATTYRYGQSNIPKVTRKR
jgi:membrane associated rhomboid family serine protease